MESVISKDTFSINSNFFRYVNDIKIVEWIFFFCHCVINMKIMKDVSLV